MEATAEGHKQLSQVLSRNLHTVSEKPDSANIKQLLDTLLEYGIFMSSEGSDVLPFSTLLDFTVENGIVAFKTMPHLTHYFSKLSSKLGYAFEDPDENECVLAEICRDRSGLEFFIEFFEPRLKQENLTKFEDWYNSELGLSKFDELLRWKLKRTPILLKDRIPEDIPESHWWWQHPDVW